MLRKLKESQNVEFKQEFELKSAKRALSGLLNSSKADNVYLYIGKDDKTGKDVLVKKIDPSQSSDLLLSFLRQYDVDAERKEYGRKGGWLIEAKPSKMVVVADGKVYWRDGTTTTAADINAYRKIVKNKDINILSKREIAFDSKNFSKLESFLAETNNEFKLVDFLIKTACIIKIGNKIYETFLADFVRDDSKLKLKLNDEIIVGPIFSLFVNTLSKVNKIAGSKEFLQDNGTRLTIEQKVPEYDEIIREIISNQLAHSAFKLLNGNSDEIRMSIETVSKGIEFFNTHAHADLQRKIENKSVSHNPHNLAVFTLLRFLNICEGKVIGFDLFWKHQEHISFEVSNSTFKIKIKGR